MLTLKASGPLKIKAAKDGTCHLDLGGTPVVLKLKTPYRGRM